MKFRRALITGASGGIGSRIAVRLASEGVHLVVHGRNVDLLEKLSSQAGNCVVLSGDLSHDNVIEELVSHCSDIDLLVNCAGLAKAGAFFERPFAEAIEQLNVNLIAVTRLCYRFGRLMSEASGGTILNIGSSAGFGASPDLAVYGATKSYILSLSKSLQYETKNVSIKCLIPGPTNTSFAARARLTRRFAGTDPNIVADRALALLQSERAIALTGSGAMLRAVVKSALPTGLQCFLQKRIR